MNTRATVVNGNTVRLWGHSQTGDLTARRLAADLDRDLSPLRMIDSSSGRMASVWLEAEGEFDDIERFTVPDGWQAEQADLFGNGTLVIDLERAEGVDR